jgi:curved DNA-binding protein CbpA
MSSLYEVLGVRRSADGAQIKAAFRTLAKSCHPDVNAGDRSAEQRFKQINLAHEVLSDPTTRATYDAECAQERLLARRRLWSAAATMTATFILTVSSGLLVAAWMRVEGLL